MVGELAAEARLSGQQTGPRLWVERQVGTAGHVCHLVGALVLRGRQSQGTGRQILALLCAGADRHVRPVSEGRGAALPYPWGGAASIERGDVKNESGPRGL